MTTPHLLPRNPGVAGLRRLLAERQIVRTFGAHDNLTALIVEQAGFETVFIGGFGTSASLLGLPDLGFLTMTEMADAIRRMARRVGIPVVADADTGHGDVHNVVRTVHEFEAAGAAGMILEDQVTPKRCGHFEGKQVIPTEEMILKIKAAKGSQSDPDFVLIARTDAREAEGLEGAIERVNRYGEAGADLVFVEAPLSVEELEVIPKQVGYPLLVNMLTGGVTPILSVQELAQLGYKIVVHPIDSLLAAAWGMRKLCESLLDEGRVDICTGFTVPFSEVKQILGVEAWLGLRGAPSP